MNVSNTKNVLAAYLMMLVLALATSSAIAQDCVDYCGENDPHIRMHVTNDALPFDEEQLEEWRKNGVDVFHVVFYEHTDANSYDLAKGWALPAKELNADDVLSQAIVLDARQTKNRLKDVAFTTSRDSLLNFNNAIDFGAKVQLDHWSWKIRHNGMTLHIVALCTKLLNCEVYSVLNSLTSATQQIGPMMPKTEPLQIIERHGVDEKPKETLRTRDLVFFETQSADEVYFSASAAETGRCQDNFDPSDALEIDLSQRDDLDIVKHQVPFQEGSLFCVALARSFEDLLDGPYCTIRQQATSWQFDLRDLEKRECPTQRETLWIHTNLTDFWGNVIDEGPGLWSINLSGRNYRLIRGERIEIPPSEKARLSESSIDAILRGFELRTVALDLDQDRVFLNFGARTLPVSDFVLRLSGEDRFAQCDVSVNESDAFIKKDEVTDAYTIRNTSSELVEMPKPNFEGAADITALEYQFGEDDSCYFEDRRKKHLVKFSDIVYDSEENVGYAVVDAFLSGLTLDVVYMGGSAAGGAHGLSRLSFGSLINQLNTALSDSLVQRKPDYKRYRTGVIFGDELEWRSEIEGPERLRAIDVDLVEAANTLFERAMQVSSDDFVTSGSNQIQRNLDKFSSSGSNTLIISMDTSDFGIQSNGVDPSLCGEFSRPSSAFLNAVKARGGRFTIIEFTNPTSAGGSMSADAEPIKECVYGSEPGSPQVTVLQLNVQNAENVLVRTSLAKLAAETALDTMARD
ncbi:MAG: hypothetical protein QNJ09_08255 [Paracoccaceae bacterium]|nr:hypothetical protein [Paracoccaceae bacterium]